MTTLTTTLAALPISMLAVMLVLRYGPDAILRVLAGVVAVLAKDEGRGARALEVLRLLQTRRSQ